VLCVYVSIMLVGIVVTASWSILLSVLCWCLQVQILMARVLSLGTSESSVREFAPFRSALSRCARRLVSVSCCRSGRNIRYCFTMSRRSAQASRTTCLQVQPYFRWHCVQQHLCHCYCLAPFRRRAFVLPSCMFGGHQRIRLGLFPLLQLFLAAGTMWILISCSL